MDALTPCIWTIQIHIRGPSIWRTGAYNWMVQIYVNWLSKWTVWWCPIGRSKYAVTDHPNGWRSNGPSMLRQFGPSKWTTVQWTAYVTSIRTVQNYGRGPLFWTVQKNGWANCSRRRQVRLHTVGFSLARAGGPIVSVCAEWLKASLLCGTQVTRVRIYGEVV